MKKYTLPLYLPFRQIHSNTLIRCPGGVDIWPSDALPSLLALLSQSGTGVRSFLALLAPWHPIRLLNCRCLLGTCLLAFSLGVLACLPATAQMDSTEGDLESVIDQVETNSWSSQDPKPYVMSQPNASQNGATPPQPGFFSQSANPPTGGSPTQKGKKTAAKEGGPKRSFWPFKMKPKETPPPSMESIVNVGPREAAASSDILFRLPLPILGRQGMMEPGFYLARPQNDSAEGKQLGIYQRSQLMVTVSVRSKGLQHPNSPVTQLSVKSPLPPLPNSQPPLTTTVEAKSQPDQEALVILLKEGGMVYESQPIPVIQREN